MTQTIDRNSNKNQEIKGKLVAREIICNLNALVEFALKSEDSESPYTWDDFENLYTYPEYRGEFAEFDGGTDEQREAEIERLKELAENNEIDFNKLGILEGEIEDLENLESEQQEIFEYWAVTNWMAEKLKEQGEPVIMGSYGAPSIWGRCTTGQAILLDYVISQIAEDMEILEGQANDWSK